MSKPIKLGFVGAGYMGQLAHIGNYARTEGVELVAIAEGRPQLAQKVAERYGIKQIYSNHKEMLAKADVDAVVAIMWFSLHHAVVPDILKAGKHLITEKAMCIKAETGRSMAKLAEERNLLYQVGYMKRSDPGSRFVQKQVQEWQETGAVGRFRYVRCTAAMTDWTWGVESPIRTEEPVPAYENENPEPSPSWMSAEQGKQYVGFVNFWIHQVNLLRYLCGEKYRLEFVSPDGLILIARTESGVPITLEMNTNQIKSQWRERFTLCFDKAEIELELGAPMHRQNVGRVRISTEGATGIEDRIPFLGSAWSFHEQAKNFVKALRWEEPVIATAADSVLDLEIAEEYTRMLAEARAQR